MKRFFLKIFWYKNSKKKRKIKEKIFKKFLSGRGSKILPLTVFLADKTEPNYDTGYKRLEIQLTLKVLRGKVKKLPIFHEKQLKCYFEQLCIKICLYFQKAFFKNLDYFKNNNTFLCKKTIFFLKRGILCHIFYLFLLSIFMHLVKSTIASWCRPSICFERPRLW